MLSEGCQEFLDFYFHVLDQVAVCINLFLAEKTKKQ